MELIIYFGIVVFTCAQSVITKMYNCKENTDVLSFNIIKSLSIFIIFLFLSLNNFDINTYTVSLSSLYGISLSISMYAGYKALKLGPVSLTSLIVSFSLIIPCLYGIIKFNEVITLIKITGFILLAISLFLTNAKFDKKAKISEKWLCYVIMTMVANGICATIQKEHQMRFSGLYLTEFTCFSMFLSTIIFVIIKICKSKIKFSKSTLFYGTISGITNGGANFLTLFLAGMENATVLFPIISAGTIIASVGAGKLIFKEKNSILKYLAILFGISAVILLKL